MKKIAFIITHLGKGGAQEYVLQIIEYLSSNSPYQIYLVYGGENHYQRRLQTLSINTVHIPELQRELHPFKDAVAWGKLVVFLLKEKIDLIHSNSSKAGFLARILKLFFPSLKVVHTVHGFPFDIEGSRLKKFIFFLLEKAVSPLTDKLILVSRYNRTQALHFGLGTLKNIALIHNGFDLEKISRLSEEALPAQVAEFVSKFQRIIGTVWRIDEQKGYKYMTEAIRRMSSMKKDVGFILVGDGPYREDLERLLKEYGVYEQVLITGFVDNPYPYYKLFDLFWTTSLWEAQPRTLCEALYLEVPAIASLVGGVGEVIINGITGFTYRWNQFPDRLLEKSIYLFEHSHLRKQMGKNGRKLIEQSYDIRKIVKKLDSLYQELLS